MLAAAPAGAALAARAILSLALCAALAADCAGGAAADGGWSAPRRLPGCALAPPRVVFPSESPFRATAAGAAVWASGDCSAGTRAPDHAGSLAVARISAGGLAGPVSEAPLTAGPDLDVAAVGASFGHIAIAVQPAEPGPTVSAVAAGGAGAGSPGAAAVYVTRAGAPIGPPAVRGVAGQPLAIARAYLGDVALAQVVAGPAIAVRLRRYFERRFESPRRIPIGSGRVGSLLVTLDYRSDVLVAWQQAGAVYAHMLRRSGRVDPTQRLGPADPSSRLQAVVSDNDHGIVAWSTTQSSAAAPAQSSAASGARTSVYLDRSEAGVRFPAPRRLAAFADPAGAGETAGSLDLVRLSNENVLLGWTSVLRGHYVVDVAPAVLAGVRPAAVLSDPRDQAILSDLATGPEGEAVALWRRTPRSAAFYPARAELWATRTRIRRGNRPTALPGVRLAPAGPNVAASAAIDPSSDRPVAAWLHGGASPVIEYAAGSSDPHYHHRAPPAGAPPSAGVHWLRIALASLAALLLAAAVAIALLRRRASRRSLR